MPRSEPVTFIGASTFTKSNNNDDRYVPTLFLRRRHDHAEVYVDTSTDYATKREACDAARRRADEIESVTRSIFALSGYTKRPTPAEALEAAIRRLNPGHSLGVTGYSAQHVQQTAKMVYGDDDFTVRKDCHGDLRLWRHKGAPSSLTP
jgi:hypothetical protein